ncbi:MAG: ubiquinol-cytochrome c reductase iron-sulfur subunit [Ignavibacteriae bacterium]|nr:ubiquinol-cytochrome c reductase iron-sulfur subunit [Ignavibacteriota bacterium]
MRSKTIISRRDFLSKSAKAAAIGALTLGSVKLDKVFSATKNNDKETSIQKTINISDYPSLQKVGGYTMITGTVIVIRTSKNKFTALSTICTHKKCDVEYTGSKFECPCHGSEYNKFGKVLNGPAKKNLKKYSTSFDEESGVLTINM